VGWRTGSCRGWRRAASCTSGRDATGHHQRSRPATAPLRSRLGKILIGEGRRVGPWRLSIAPA
jgi:hypothetical protein